VGFSWPPNMAIADMDDDELERLMAAAASYDDDDEGMAYSSNELPAGVAPAQSSRAKEDDSGPVLLGAPSSTIKREMDAIPSVIADNQPAFVLSLPPGSSDDAASDLFRSSLLARGINRGEAQRLLVEVSAFLGASSKEVAMESELRELRVQLNAAHARATSAEARAARGPSDREPEVTMVCAEAAAGQANEAVEPVQVFGCSVPFEEDEDASAAAPGPKAGGSKVTKVAQGVLRSLSFNRGRRSRKE